MEVVLLATTERSVVLLECVVLDRRLTSLARGIVTFGDFAILDRPHHLYTNNKLKTDTLMLRHGLLMAVGVKLLPVGFEVF